MSRRVFGLVEAIVGLFLLLFFALADVTGLGHHPGRFGPKQTTGTIIGAIILIVGIIIFFTSKKKEA